MNEMKVMKMVVQLEEEEEVLNSLVMKELVVQVQEVMKVQVVLQILVMKVVREVEQVLLVMKVH